MSPCLWSAWWTLITRTADMAFNRCSHLCFGSFTVRCLPRTFFDFCLIQFPQVVNLGGGSRPPRQHVTRHPENSNGGKLISCFFWLSPFNVRPSSVATAVAVSY